MNMHIICSNGVCEISLDRFAEICELGSTMKNTTIPITASITVEFSLEAVSAVLFNNNTKWSCVILNEAIYVMDFLQFKNPETVFSRAAYALAGKHSHHKNLGPVVMYMISVPALIEKVYAFVNIMDSQSLTEFVREDIHGRWELLNLPNKIRMNDQLHIPVYLLDSIIIAMSLDQLHVVFDKLFKDIELSNLNSVNADIVATLVRTFPSRSSSPEIKRKLAVLRCFIAI